MASKENTSVNENCPVSATIRLIGGKYKALLLWHLTGQTLRFNQLHRLVPTAPRAGRRRSDFPHSLPGRSAPRRLLADGARRKPFPDSRSDVPLGQRSDEGRRAYAGMYDDRQLQYNKKRTGELPLLFLSYTFKILSYTLACRTIPIPMGYGPVCTPIVAPI